MSRLSRLALALLVTLPVVATGAAQTLTTIRIASGISNPTSICSPPGDLDRLFVTSGTQGIFIIKNGVLLPQPFLDLQGQLDSQGLADMAFHPDYATNGRFFIVTLEPGLFTRVTEYQVSADPDLADDSSALTIMGPEQQFANTHLWNQLEFGPDGKLYMSTGDGILGDPNQNHSQDLGNINGKILRLDIDIPAPYIPADNPFVGAPGARGEIFALGLRNPWRMFIDASTDTFYVGDVGQGEREELNIVSMDALRGANFGWRCLEGSVCTDFGGCTADCLGTPWIRPAFEFDHSQGCAMIAGEVYRGSEIPGLDGTFFFADWCTATFWTFRWNGSFMVDFQDRSAELQPAAPLALELPNSFGSDAAGNLYILDKQGNEVFRIVEDCSGIVEADCPATANSVGPGAELTGSGSTSMAAGDFTLSATGCPADKLGIFFYGVTPANLPFGNGTRCIATPIHRLFPVAMTDATGRADMVLDFNSPPISVAPSQIFPAVDTYFQFWYRDPAAGGATFDASSSIHVRFCP